jgi:hypothetical protein
MSLLDEGSRVARPKPAGTTLRAVPSPAVAAEDGFFAKRRRKLIPIRGTLKVTKSATVEYETAAAATRAKTERLRALRLARDAAAPPPEPAAPKRKGKKKSSATLAAFLDGAAKEGRNG